MQKIAYSKIYPLLFSPKLKKLLKEKGNSDRAFKFLGSTSSFNRKLKRYFNLTTATTLN